jgi:hypothetical protein
MIIGLWWQFSIRIYSPEDWFLTLDGFVYDLYVIKILLLQIL